MIGVYRTLMHRWERKLTLRDRNRRIYPFRWGLEWLDPSPDSNSDPLETLKTYSRKAVESSEEFFFPPPIEGVKQDDQLLTFNAPFPSPHEENRTVRVKIFPNPRARKAVIVVPQWNADAGSHIGICRLLQKLGFTAARLTLPYHEERNPSGMIRADLAVSPNLGRTLHANRQAVLEVRQLTHWLKAEGYQRVGILGTSLGSCISYLSMAHEPELDLGVFNHVSAYFGEVVWTGLSCRYIRWGLDGEISLEDLRECWAPLSPWFFVVRFQNGLRPHLLISARYDLTFLPECSERIFERYRSLGIPYQRKVLPCGHYTTAHFPYNLLDAWWICRYFKKYL